MKIAFSIILSLIFLITSSGFVISSHLCGGKKVKTEFGLTINKVSCGMDKERNNCVKGTQMQSSCCQNQFRLVQIDEDYTQQYNKVEFNKEYAVALFTVITHLFPEKSIQQAFYSDYSPPLVRNIPILIQSFLI